MVESMQFDLSSGGVTPTEPRCMGMMEEFLYRHDSRDYEDVPEINPSPIAMPISIINIYNKDWQDIGSLYNEPMKQSTNNMLTKLAYR